MRSFEKSLLFSAICLCFVLIQSAFAAAAPLQRSGPLAGQIISNQQGEDIVFVQEETKRAALAGQDLKAGDVIRTNRDGALSIVFADHTQIRIGRNTELVVKAISSGNPSELQVNWGNLWARAPRGKSKLRVTTPSAVAAIRGTEWSLQVSKTETHLQVASGEVAFANVLGALQVTGGEAARAEQGKAPVKVLVVNRSQREQMLFFLQDEADLSAGNPVLAQVQALARVGELEAAHSKLQTQKSQVQNLAEYYILQARLGFLAGEQNRIASALREGLAQFPQHPELLRLRAEFHTHYSGRPDLGLADAIRADALFPGNGDILLTLSKAYLERRADKEALATIEKAISGQPNRADLYLQKAEILLFQNRPHQAMAALEQARIISPELTLIRLALGQAYALAGEQELAFDEFLAASVEYPAYSRAQLRLAELYGRQRETALAEQQLDAADRLDPFSPYTQLYRTALGLDQYQTDAATKAAFAALRRFQARGGIYENLQENRETGSNLSGVYRFAGLQSAARYFGDRVYDSFAATSYYDQVLNEQAGLFHVRQDNTSFNPSNGDDIQQISSFLQGLALDPLGVANSQQDLQISKEAFVEASLGVSYISAQNEMLRRANGSLQGRHYFGSRGNDLPIAFSLKAQSTIFDDDFQKITRDSSAYELYVGSELSASDNVAIYGTLKKEDKHIAIDRVDFLQTFGGEHDFAEDQYFGVILWNHQLAYRKNFSIAAGYDEKDDFDIVYTPVIGATGAEAIKVNETFNNKVYLVSANYAQGVGKFTYKIGTDIFFKDRSVINQVERLLADGNIVDLGTRLLPQTSNSQQRLYADARYQAGDKLVLQGQISFLNEDIETLVGNTVISSHDSKINYHVGGAWEVSDKHWFRAAAFRTNTDLIPFSLSPLYTVGLKGSLIPSVERSAIESRIVRWDAQWADNFFTSAEFQNQVFDEILYTTPDRDKVISVLDGRINQFAFSANYLPGNNWALFANATYANTAGNLGIVRQDLPFVPSFTANAGANWTHPSRIRVRVTGTYIGKSVDISNRTLDAHFNLNASLGWEPLNKKMQFQLGVLNLLDANYETRVGIPAPGVTLFASGSIRF
jgi:hypothetical protein